MLFVVSFTGLRDALDLNLKSTARKLSQTIRYVRNKAVTDHLTLRMAFDLDKHTFWVEESSAPFVVAGGQEEEKPDKAKEEKTGEGEEAEAKENPFTASESKLLKAQPLPSGVFFKDVLVSYLGEKKESGQVFAYFFPDGFATEATIHLRDEEDNYFTLQVMPLTGRVKVRMGYEEETSAEEEAP